MRLLSRASGDYLPARGAGRAGASRTGFTLIEVVVVVGIGFVALALLLVGIQRVRESANAVQDRKAIGVAAEGYLANKEAFSFFTCRFEAVKATAASTDAALKGTFIKQEPISDGVWVVKGDQMYVRLSCDPALIASAARDAIAAKALSYHAPCLEEHFLTDGRFRLSAGFSVKTANFFAPEQEFTPPDAIPWRLGEWNVGHILEECLRGRRYGQFDGFDDAYGKHLMAFSAGYNSPKNIYFRGFLDPERGFLPICQWFIADGGAIGFKEYITQTKQYGNKGWFPERTVMVYEPGGKPPFVVRVITVKSLDVDHVPTESDLEMDLGYLNQVVDVSDPHSAFRPTAGEKINANQLAELGAKLTRIAQQPDVIPAGPPEKPFAWGMFAGISLLAASVVIGFLAYRRRRVRAEPGTNDA